MRSPYVSLSRLMVGLAGALLVVGCSAGGADEDADVASSSDSALTQSQAYQLLIGADGSGQTFVTTSTGCGHTLTLGRDPGSSPNTGRFVYTFIDCDAGGRRSAYGSFEVVPGWMDGVVTDPTLKIFPEPNPARPDDDMTPWTYKIRTEHDDDGQIPRGAIYLESTSDHGAKLIPQGYIS